MSILTTIKKMLGLDEDYIHFDSEIIVDINSVLMILTQLGVGPDEGFYIVDKTETWGTYLNDRKDLEAVKTYIYLKVRLLFDPPTNAFLVDSIERQIKELEWRLTEKT
jgi:hypothetical protein